jgi:hypothetical protein
LVLFLAGTELKNPPLEVASHGRTDSGKLSRIGLRSLVRLVVSLFGLRIGNLAATRRSGLLSRPETKGRAHRRYRLANGIAIRIISKMILDIAAGSDGFWLIGQCAFRARVLLSASNVGRGMRTTVPVVLGTGSFALFLLALAFGRDTGERDRAQSSLRVNVTERARAGSPSLGLSRSERLTSENDAVRRFHMRVDQFQDTRFALDETVRRSNTYTTQSAFQQTGARDGRSDTHSACPFLTETWSSYVPFR